MSFFYQLSTGDKVWVSKEIQITNDTSTIFLYYNKLLHRLDGPAIEYANGYKEWYLNGEFHRENGPAIEYANGSKKWYLNGKKMTEEEYKFYWKGKKDEFIKTIYDLDLNSVNMDIAKVIASFVFY